jgi:RNA 2',3'-cyclic 3'-phosphodiesterase
VDGAANPMRDERPGPGGRGGRLFVAIEVPEAVRRDVKRRLAGLRDRLPRARWVDPDLLHLTLVFLGDVASDRVPALSAALAAFTGHPPIPLRLGGGGTFPEGRPARVAWLGVEAPDELRLLQQAALEAAAEAVGHEPEERPYRAHVTLARLQTPWPRDASDKYRAAFPGAIGQPFTALRGVLLDSTLSPRGPRYREVASLPLLGEGAEREGAQPTGGADGPIESAGGEVS